jgi:hypothetical protein
MYKAVSELARICEAFGKRSVYEGCLSQIPETVATIFGNSFQFPGRNMKADVQGSFIADSSRDRAIEFGVGPTQAFQIS